MAKNLSIGVQENLFVVAQTEVENIYNSMLADLDSEISAYRATGMSDRAIYKALLSDFENDSGIFKRFTGGLERSMDGLVVRSTQSENVADNPPEQMYLWMLDPTVEKHCDDCLEREAMQAQTMEEWTLIGIPGSGVTECGDYCKCMLEEA